MKKNLGRLRQVFRRAKVLDMKSLGARFEDRSRRSLYRDLSELGYLTSYTHGGLYYTLAEIPDFDEWGLWFYQDIGFSRAGTVKQTVGVQVEEAPDGRTHAELSALVRVRVHNTLLDLVQEGRIDRVQYGGVHLYVSADAQRAVEQVEQRRGADSVLAEALWVPTIEETVEILVEALRGTAEVPPAADVARRLAARDIRVDPRHVLQVYETHGLKPGKKTAPPI